MMGQETQGHMMMPAQPAPDLVVVQAQAAFTLLEEERHSLPVLWYQSEYECVFGDTVNSIFRTEDIDAMFAADVEPLFPEGI